MPYIEKQDRHILRQITNLIWLTPTVPTYDGDITNNIYYSARTMFENWIQIKREQGKSIDGYVNFMLTTMIIAGSKRTENIWKITTKFVVDTILSVYRTPENYSNYQKGFGLLSCMDREFKRRGWLKDFPRTRKWFAETINWWGKLIDTYEHLKLIKNGDIFEQ